MIHPLNINHKFTLSLVTCHSLIERENVKREIAAGGREEGLKKIQGK